MKIALQASESEDHMAFVRSLGLSDVDFDGVIRIDHCPGVVGDNPRADRSFAFQVGYLRGPMQSLETMGVAS
jgi:hypothetical protein